MSIRARSRGGAALNAVLILGIIAVVVAILLPAIVPRPIHSYKSFCQSNLKECANALALYAQDYDGHLPSSALVGKSKSWNRRDFLTFATRIGKLPPDPKQPAKTWPQILYGQMKNKDIMFCYSDSVDREKPGPYVSYWWKLAIDKAGYGEGCSKAYRKLDDFQRAADQVFLYEHQPFHFGGAGGLLNGAQINVAFLDTHVKTITLQNATSGDPVNCAANSDGEPMYFNFDTKKPEGKGNPPPENVPARYVDPGRYSDYLP